MHDLAAILYAHTNLSGIALLVLWISAMGATKKHTFGFYRLQLLGSMVSIFIIYIVTGN